MFFHIMHEKVVFVFIDLGDFFQTEGPIHEIHLTLLVLQKGTLRLV